MNTSAHDLCKFCPQGFRQFTEAVINLKFEEDPKYSYYVRLLEPLCGPAPNRAVMFRGGGALESGGTEGLELLYGGVVCNILTATDWPVLELVQKGRGVGGICGTRRLG